MEERFKFLEHTADIKFQSYGKTLEKAFENAAKAMFKAMYEGKVKSKEKRKIKIMGKDRESLLYNLLEELLFLLDSENFFLSDVKVKINKEKTGRLYKLKADLTGDKAGNYQISLDVKAATYNEMFVKQEKGRWVCQVVLDV